MTSEIRANTIKNRVGLGTVSFTNTGPVVSGIVTANTFRLPDSTSGSLGRLQLGNGLDLSLFHDGTNSFLVNNTGYLSIQSQDGVNGIFIARNAEVNLYYGSSVRMQTSSAGITVNKDLDVDGHTNLDNLSVAGVSTFSDGKITFDALGNISGRYVDLDQGNGTKYIDANLANGNQLSLRGYVGSGYHHLADFVRGGLVGLNYSGNRKLETSNTGVTISGSAAITHAATLGNGSGLNFGDTGARIIGETGASGYLRFDTNGGEKLRINSNGDILTSESSQLFGSNTSDGSDNKSIMINGGGAKSDTRGGYLLVHGNEHSSNPGITRLHAGNVGSAYIAFNTAGNERLRITSTGELQVGSAHTTSTNYGWNPVARFQIETANDPSTIHFGQRAGGSADPAIIFLRRGGSTPWVHHAGRIYYDTEKFNFETSNAEAPGSHSFSKRMVIKNNGNIGINDDNPADALTIAKNHSQLRLKDTDDNKFVQLSYSSSKLIVRNNSINTTVNQFTLTDTGLFGIGNISPQAKLHIGNYETTENVNQSSVTQYFIDSTKSLKIARCNRGSITSSGWYDVAVITMSGFSYRCQVSLGGDFTQDVLDIDVQTAYASGLNNKYSLQLSAKSAHAHNNDRMSKVKVVEKSGTFYLQVYISGGVNSNTNGKSVLETTCGIYAQNAADNAYPMFAAASGSYNTITRTLPDFGVHGAWDFTCNSSGVRSYTAWTGGGNEFVVAENAGNGTSQGTVGRFIAPMKGLYQVNFNVKNINASGNNQVLIVMYGSMTYDAQNPWHTNAEVYDPRGAGTGAQGQQGEGNSWWLRMAKDDYFSFDYYRPGTGSHYIDGGGQLFGISVFKVGSP